MAIPTLTYYSVSADLTTLSAILNGVAMICKQDAMIWGFAVMVALWRLLASATVGALRTPTGQGAAVLANGPMSALMPFVLAMVLTNPGLKGTVQVESTINGALTEVDNVPLAISIIPASASLLSQDLNSVISTAFQSVNMEYPTISATTNGFLNPLKVLLSSRSSMVRLGGVDSEIKTVLSACLGPDSGVNYANIQQLVQNAGNTGATAATSIAINGINPTALGALLYQAASNTNGMVNDPGLSGTNMLSCYDAANKVADDITNALNSVEFSRVVQGAVNGMDQPVPGADYSFNSVASKYNAVATANTLGGVFTGGAAQANAEFMNLLFAELVQTDLNCLKASGDMLTNCQATALQAAEIERNNLQQAAAEVPMLRYAGNFGNYLIALIIGLGPVIVMFMMFLGVDAGKSVKTAAHIMVWPLLVVNVGAELVNAMLCIDVANFLQSLRQGGWISHASTFAAYKQLSLQIGVGSHIMASLPVLMSLIFGLGESSAMTSVASSIAPKSHETADNVAPAPSVTRPMFENSSIGRSTQLPNGQANLAMNGALEAVSSSATFGNLSRDASRVLTKAQTQSASIEAGQSNMRQWAAAAQKHDFSGFGIDNSIGEQIVKGWEARRNGSRNQHAGTGVTGARANENTTASSMHAGAGASLSTGDGFGLSVSAGGNVETSTNAGDRLQATKDAGSNASYDDSKALSDSIHDTLSATRHTSAGQQAAKDLTQTLQTQESYQQTLSEVKSVSDATASALHESSNFVQASAQIKAPELLWQSRANPEFAAFSALEGRKFDESAAAKPYLQLAQSDASHGATDRVVNSQEGQQLVNRHRAAVLMAQDQSAPAADRAMALNYLTQEGQAMQHMRFTPGDTSMKSFELASPGDHTGVNTPGLQKAVQRATPALPAAALAAAGTAGTAPTHRPAAPSAHRAPGGHVPHREPSRPPQSTTPPSDAAHLRAQGAPDLDPNFKRMVENNVSDSQRTVDGKVGNAERQAANAGLDDKGAGTARRMAANVVDNVEDLGRKAGSPSRTTLVDAPAPAPARTPARAPANTPAPPVPTPTPSPWPGRGSGAVPGDGGD